MERTHRKWSKVTTDLINMKVGESCTFENMKHSTITSYYCRNRALKERNFDTEQVFIIRTNFKKEPIRAVRVTRIN